ncbi:MAG: metallophosphoesterase [bacterium]
MAKKIKILILSIMLLQACSDTKPFIRKILQGDPNQRPNNPEVITFYALGDWGTGNKHQEAVAEALRENVSKIPKGRKISPLVLGLGDNIYSKGLPEGWNNPKVHQLLEKTFGQIYKDVQYEGRELVYYMIPGNHDHGGKPGGKNGWGDVIQQETMAEKLYEPYWRYYPIDPAKNADTNDSTDYHTLKEQDIFSLTLPEQININESKTIAIVAIDTQVLLKLYSQKDFKMVRRHWERLESLLEEEVDLKIVIGHHPLKSHGRHGGFRPLVEWTWSGTTGFIKPWWIRPLTFIWLPFLSTSIDKLFLKLNQDLDNSAYKHFQHDLIQLMNLYNVKIYLSGHEHSLQFLMIDNNHFQIISGSAGKLSPVTHKNDTLFSHTSPGFVRFDITTNEIWVEFFQVDIKSSSYQSSALFKINN